MWSLARVCFLKPVRLAKLCSPHCALFAAKAFQAAAAWGAVAVTVHPLVEEGLS